MAEITTMTREELVAEVERLRGQLVSCRGQLVEQDRCSAWTAEIEQLREAKATLGLANLIVENSPAVLFRRLADDTRKLVYVSENLRQWGYTAAEFLSGRKTFADILHSGDKDRIADELAHYQDQNVEEYAQEYRLVTADGRVRWVSDETSVVRDGQGQRLYNQGVLLDITGRKLAEEALAASEFKFRRIIEGAAEGYLLMDADLVIKEVNDAYCHMLGYERQELVGRRPHDFATLEYQRFLESNSVRFRVQKNRRFEGSMVHKDGHVVPVLINANSLQDNAGEFFGNVAFVAELTEQKKAMELAGEVQKSLLPSKAPRVPGLDVAGASVASEAIGGDYFDYLEDVDTNPSALSVVVGDISGHGVDAALLMTTARGFLRMRAGQPGSPAQIVTEMNRHLADDLYGSGRFMTLFYLRLDAKTAKAQWVRAGHDPAIIYCPVMDTFTELGVEAGLPLGVIRETRYREEAGDLKPGQIIAVGTDGIWEARNREGVMFGKARYKAILREHAGGTAKEMLDAVYAALHEYTGGSKPDDDITLVIVKYGTEA